MIRCILVDDEAKNLENLKILLQDFCQNVEVLALCQTVDEALVAIRSHRPDVVFLDIQMQRETGFDLLTRVDHVDFDVIFITAYSEYAIKAFRFSAIDYLLKPIDIEELKRALTKVEKKSNNDMAGRLEQLFQNLKSKNGNAHKIAIPIADGLVFVNIETILYCEASSNYTQIFLNDGKKYVVSRTLKEYEELLSEHDFFRIHNSFVINLNAIKKYVRGDGGYVVMNNDATLDVSKRRKEAFLERFGH
ncbi:LytTR family DNA-binding domain-containing protein [Chryseolinea sp. T2]|uniref:LytR/AlgR family response regulator transcription factor n=1 Tax=Chryseolinea sp. T2 TaxID=3129255 RepID=UPI0030775B3A